MLRGGPLFAEYTSDDAVPANVKLIMDHGLVDTPVVEKWV